MSRIETLIFKLGYFLLLLTIEINLYFHFTLQKGKALTTVAGERYSSLEYFLLILIYYCKEKQWEDFICIAVLWGN